MSLSTPRSSPPPRAEHGSTVAMLDSDHLDSSDGESVSRPSSAQLPSDTHDDGEGEVEEAESDAHMSDGDSRRKSSPAARQGLPSSGMGGKRRELRRGAAGARSGGKLDRERSGVEGERAFGQGEKLLDRDYQRIEFDPFKELETASLALAGADFGPVEVELVPGAAEASTATATAA